MEKIIKEVLVNVKFEDSSNLKGFLEYAITFLRQHNSIVEVGHPVFYKIDDDGELVGNAEEYERVTNAIKSIARSSEVEIGLFLFYILYDIEDFDLEFYAKFGAEIATIEQNTKAFLQNPDTWTQIEVKFNIKDIEEENKRYDEWSSHNSNGDDYVSCYYLLSPIEEFIIKRYDKKSVIFSFDEEYRYNINYHIHDEENYLELPKQKLLQEFCRSNDRIQASTTSPLFSDLKKLATYTLSSNSLHPNIGSFGEQRKSIVKKMAKRFFPIYKYIQNNREHTIASLSPYGMIKLLFEIPDIYDSMEEQTLRKSAGRNEKVCISNIGIGK